MGGFLLALGTVASLVAAFWPDGDRPTITTVRCPTCKSPGLSHPRKARSNLPAARASYREGG
jgi:hypothetical protein